MASILREAETVITRPLVEAMLTAQCWWRRTVPFPHIVAPQVFVPDMYESLAQTFARVPDTAFTRSMPGYDASAVELTRHTPFPFSVFVSRAWHDLLATVVGVPCSGEVVASLHHHEPQSATGFIHNDLNPGWFTDDPKDDGIVVSDHPECAYKTGPLNGTPAHRSVRAIVMLFYLNNPPWQPGDGGETGLYRSATVCCPSATIPPLNNSLVCFPVTPDSYHRFLTNPRSPRNSVILWLHRRYEAAVEHWGEDRLVEW